MESPLDHVLIRGSGGLSVHALMERVMCVLRRAAM